MVLVDSDVWSLVFRRKTSDASSYTTRLIKLIESDEVRIIGPVRQEVLSGIQNPKQFEVVRKQLKAFPDQSITTDIYELAASFFNACRSKGAQGSHTDFLICACAVSWKMRILSKDNDYSHYSKVIPIELDSF
jgi:predicted nucleic acid-binding protein